ncbi:hypothetical protein ACFQ21_00170 [Ohtaekwangia kribbensis]|uniref:Terminase ATPase subunit N-terminal domain-containing protein n=1 Tax=Ohtaekwangia kribbensis TaxID=688913 RepID=A0ABW3JY26_9BACT
MTDKQKDAQEMFEIGWDQKRIAKILDVSEQTITTWKQKYRWEEKRAKKGMNREAAEDLVWKLINYQLNVINKQVKDAELRAEKEKDYELPTLDKGDIDALQKLWTTVKAKQLDWSVVVNNTKDFIGFVSERDIDLAKKLLDIADDYMHYKRKNL